MLKRLIIIISIIIITGCSLSNNPNSKTEELLGKYQSLDNSIILSPKTLANDNNLSIDLEKEYTELIKKQYQSMSYEIKDTKEDGDKATVTVEIEVLDYKKIINQTNGPIDDNYHKRLIDKLKQAHDKVTYTIDITLTKDNRKNWETEPLTTDEENKLLGIY